jgi:hypothetical protein
MLGELPHLERSSWTMRSSADDKALCCAILSASPEARDRRGGQLQAFHRKEDGARVCICKCVDELESYRPTAAGVTCQVIIVAHLLADRTPQAVILVPACNDTASRPTLQVLVQTRNWIIRLQLIFLQTESVGISAWQLLHTATRLVFVMHVAQVFNALWS